MQYYDEGFELNYKKTKKEEKDLEESKRPDLYNRKTNNQELFCFMNASHTDTAILNTHLIRDYVLCRLQMD